MLSGTPNKQIDGDILVYASHMQLCMSQQKIIQTIWLKLCPKEEELLQVKPKQQTEA